PLSADHDGARHMTGHWPPVAAHYDHDPPRVRGDLRTHRPQRQPGPPAAAAGPQHYYVGARAQLTQHVRRRPAGQQRPDITSSHGRLDVLHTASDDALAVFPG